jgi:type II secretory pathway pseudopilin PulG
VFSLIIVIISVVIVIALAIAVLWYGGSAYTSANAEAVVSQLVNQGSQIKAATLLFETDNAGNNPASITDLVTGGYLASVPNNWSVTQSGTQIAYTAVNSSEVCIKFNAKYGITGVPSCSSISTNEPVCCQ